MICILISEMFCNYTAGQVGK